MVKCVRVPKEDGESVRERLLSSDLLDRGAKIKADGGFILIPILSDNFESYEAVDANLEPTEMKERDYRNITAVPDELKEILPNSFDVIGDIAVVKMPDELIPYANAVGDAMLSTSSSLRAVFMDAGVKGDLRIRDVRIIAGTGPSETTYKEFGVTMIADPVKAYFNPRLSTERMRIASLVKDGESIIDMFAGVAPFPLVIAKHSKPSVIHSIDVNADAVDLAERNIRMNKIDNVKAICGDSREVIKTLPMADRIIMNLPQMADSFLPDALSRLKNGGMVHMHKIMERSPSDVEISELVKKMRDIGYSIRVDRAAELKTYSPTASVYVLDIIKE